MGKTMTLADRSVPHRTPPPTKLEEEEEVGDLPGEEDDGGGGTLDVFGSGLRKLGSYSVTSKESDITSNSIREILVSHVCFRFVQYDII